MTSAASGSWALVPVKRFDRAKSRLADALDGPARAGLAAAMLEDVLDVLIRSKLFAGTLVVTSDPDAAAIARRLGAAVIEDVANDGVNAAVAQGVRRLSWWGAARVTIVPSDVPLLTVEEIGALVAAGILSPVAMTPATRDGGTNLLALCPIDVIAPAFGADSLSRHVDAAVKAGVEPSIVPLKGAGVDIDVPADLDAVRRSVAGTRTRLSLARLERPADQALDINILERIPQP